LPGGSAYLKAPWLDREDLRYLLDHCTALITGPDCELPVSGVVGRAPLGNAALSDMKFLIRSR
jgi:hypothetical protein